MFLYQVFYLQIFFLHLCSILLLSLTLDSFETIDVSRFFADSNFLDAESNLF